VLLFISYFNYFISIHVKICKTVWTWEKENNRFADGK